MNLSEQSLLASTLPTCRRPAGRTASVDTSAHTSCQWGTAAVFTSTPAPAPKAPCDMEAANDRLPRTAISTIEALLGGTVQLDSSEWFFRLQQQCSGLRQPLQFKARPWQGCKYGAKYADPLISKPTLIAER